MSVRQRNNVQIIGDGPQTLVFSHGFGCDQNIWRLVTPEFSAHYRMVLFDLVGAGLSDLSAYDRSKYARLEGYASDLLEIIEEFSSGPIVYIGHSISAMIGMLAELAAPSRFLGQVMIGPSPCYINDGGYIGGFSRADIDSLLEALENNYLGWSSSMAPTVMGAPGQPALSIELTNSFCRTDPAIAKQFARVIFTGDYRAQLAGLTSPTLILQCSEDLIVPVSVGHYLHGELPNATLKVIDNIGHFPHLSSPVPIIAAISGFLASVTNAAIVSA